MDLLICYESLINIDSVTCTSIINSAVIPPGYTFNNYLCRFCNAEIGWTLMHSTQPLTNIPNTFLNMDAVKIIIEPK